MSRSSLVVLLLVGSAFVMGCGSKAPHLTAGEPQASSPTPNEPTVLATPAWDASTTVGTVVAERPRTARLFELVGIDYCCGGEETLAHAAKEHDLDVGRLLDTLQAMGRGSKDDEQRDWLHAPLDDLMKHIVSTHHVYLRRELPRLSEIVNTVHRVHGESHPELAEIQQIFTSLQAAMPRHLEKEEAEVFPAIRTLASSDATQVRTMLAELRTDHDEVGQALHRLRKLTAGYKRPADACALYIQMLDGLADLERDLHTHVHLENEVLLPRALASLKGS